MTRIAVVAGAVLGVMSPLEETTAGFSMGISANATWLGLAFVVGVAARRAPAARAAVAAAGLTAANASYYAWIAAWGSRPRRSRSRPPAGSRR